MGFKYGPGAWWFAQACDAQRDVRAWDLVITKYESSTNDPNGVVMCLLRQKAQQEIAAVLFLRAIAEMCNDH